LNERRDDYRLTTIDETTLEGRNVLVSDFPDLSCNYSVEVEPGFIDFMVGYSPSSKSGITERDVACDYARQVAETFAPYFPDTLY
ncbi:MAG: DUF3558 domain-containing protein, partial [Rhodococcus sp.]|nr:DUF3558 domain-containing protein [Rhodococcus sp. (in: high G+C Gram-positive bacteria)]